MSADPLAVVQGFFDLVAADKFDAIPEMLDPEIVWFGTRGGLDEHRVIRGPDECVAYMREIEEPWGRLDVVVERLIKAEDAVVALLRERAQVRGGDIEVTNETAMLLRVQRGKIVEARGYLRRGEALTAAGLAV